MGVEMSKPWLPLTEQALERVSGQLGVFELADADQEICYIGFAGGRSTFGLKGELAVRLNDARWFRVEITAAYRTRHRELLMARFARTGRYPRQNTPEDTRHLGRLSPA